MGTLYYMPWTERERGWGQRPDGCSLHDSPQSCALFVKAHSDSLPQYAPDEYDLPDWAQPKPLSCSDGFLALVKASGGSLRLGKNTCEANLTAGTIVPLLPELVRDILVASSQAEKASLEEATPEPDIRGKKPSL